MTYRAEIEIGVKGTEKLRELRNTVDLLANRIDKLDSLADVFNSPIQSLKNYNQTLRTTAKALEQVELGQKDEATAIRKYVQALGEANAARARQNNLIQQEIALQEAAKRKTQPGPTGFSRAQFGPALPPAFIKQQNDQQNFKNLFADLNETAKVISVSNTNTRTSWKRTFDELNETAKAISVSRLNTQASWNTTFNQLNETAKAIAVNRLNTQTSWQETFKQLNETAKAISVSRLNTQTSWQETFKQLNETAKAISVSRLNTKKAWQDFFKEATEVAKDLRRDAARVSLRKQERPLFVKETISRGRSARIARERSAFLQGSSGPVQLGPSGRGPGASGFPVAVPLNRAEQKALELTKKRLEILERTKQIVKDLSGSNEKLAAVTKRGITDEERKNGLIRQRFGLRGALQDLETKSKVAIADANREQNKVKQSIADSRREQEKLNQERKEGLKVLKEEERTRRQIRNRARKGTVAAGRERQRRTRDAASNALIGGAFPLLFGQGAGASLGGAVGGGLGGLAGGQFGFGLSLVGTAVGQAIDTFIAKSSELGQALDLVNGDVDTVINSLGLANTATANYIRRLEEVAGKQVALEEATKQLALVVGDEGVQALREFGEATKDLGNGISVFVTGVLAEAAKLLNRPTRGISDAVSDFNFQRQGLASDDPKQALLRTQLANASTFAESEQILRQIIELQKEITQEAQKETEAKLNAVSPTLQVLANAERKLKIEELNGDILNDQVLSLEKQALTEKFKIENQKVLRDLLAERLTFQESLNLFKANELILDQGILALNNKRSKADQDDQERKERAARRAAREGEAAAKRAERVRKQEEDAFKAAQLSADKSVDLPAKAQLKLTEALKGREAALKEQLADFERISENEQKILRQTFQQRVDNVPSASKRVIEEINREYFNTLDALGKQQEAQKALAEQELKRLQVARERASFDLKTSFDRNVEDAQFGLRQAQVAVSDPFGGQQQQTSLLNLDQERERLELTRRLTDQRLALTQAVKDADEASKIGAQEDLRNFDAQKTQLENLLAKRQAVEQQQLKQNQILEKYGFIINEVSTALSSSIQAIITGTGSVEEAFSNLFQNIGQAFVNLATQVLAQKAFLAVLNLFNPGSSLLSGGLKLKGGSGDIFSDIASRGGLRLKGFADGGRPPVNRPSIVGEQGPELFVPFQQGTIVSNEDLQEQMAKAGVSSMERPSSSRFRETREVMVPFTRSAEQLSVASAERETAQAISNPRPLDVRFESQVINNVEYVTADQYRKGMSQAAERGRALTLQALQNSVKARKRIGL